MADLEQYNERLERLKKYIPFLVNMMAELKAKGNREAQFNKIQSLHAMITDKKKKLKLETLSRCEEVLHNIYDKVNPQLRNRIPTVDGPESPKSTPASPSPSREIYTAQPVCIPVEKVSSFEPSRLGHTNPRNSYLPKVDVYSSAAESLSKPKKREEPHLARLPDMTKPPISLDDLKTLEEDVHEKIQAAKLTSASMTQLNNLREKIAMQIRVENVNKAMSPKKTEINTTVRNNLNLKKVAQSPDKHKHENNVQSNEKADAIAVKDKSFHTPVSKTAPKECPKDNVSSSNKPQTPKVLKESDSIFGSLLSSIDNKLLEDKKKIKKEERRSSKDEQKLKEEKHKDDIKDKNKDDKEDKTKEKEENSKEDVKEKKKEDSSEKDERNKDKDRRNSLEKEKKHKDSKSKEEHKDKEKKSESKKKDEIKDTTKDNSDKKKDKKVDSKDKKSDKKDEDKKKDTSKSSKSEKEDKKHSSSSKKSGSSNSSSSKSKESESKVKKSESKIKTDNVVKNEQKTQCKFSTEHTEIKLENVKPTKDEPKTFKRLADKYNPKPRKQNTDSDLDRTVNDIIEQNMKISPVKIPLLPVPEPVPPPASLVRLSLDKNPTAPEPKVQLPEILQNILNPKATQMIKTITNQLQHQNIDAASQKPSILSPPQHIPLLSPPNKPSLLGPGPGSLFPARNLGADPRQNHPNLGPGPPPNLGLQNPGPVPAPNHLLNNFSLMVPRMNFEPPQRPDDFRMNHQFRPNLVQARPLMDEMARPFDNPNNFPMQNNRSMTPFQPEQQHMFNQPHQQFNNFNQNQFDNHQPMDFYNNFNNHCGPPLLSPEMPQYINETKPHFYHERDMRSNWNNDNNCSPWARVERDTRTSRDPRSYREYKEMKEKEARENRDPRQNRDPRENRDASDSKDPRENRDAKDSKDPRENRDARDSKDPREKKDRDSRETVESKDPRDRDIRDSSSRNSRESNSSRDPRDRSRARETETRERSRRSRYDSKFDRMYSRTNSERSRSRSRSRVKEDETFISPLDSLYSGKEVHKTGKGYGVQSFRIPKVKKEEPEKKEELDKKEEKDKKEEEYKKEELCKKEELDTKEEPDKKQEPVNRESDSKVKELDVLKVVQTDEQIHCSKDVQIDDETETEEMDVNDNSIDSSNDEAVNAFRSEWEDEVSIAKEDSETDTKLKESTETEDSKFDALLASDIKVDKEEEIKAEKVTGNQVDEKSKAVDKIEEKIEEPKTLKETEPLKTNEEATPSQPAENVTSQETRKSEEPQEQNILAHFFENLLKSRNKRDKKTALFSLIETFSDSFSDRELKKITKIIKTNEDDQSSDDNSEPSAPKEKIIIKEPVEIEIEDKVVPQTEEIEAETPLPTAQSSTEKKLKPENESKAVTSSIVDEESKTDESKETEESKTEESKLESEEEKVVVSVGERIKSRKRNTPPKVKPRKKGKTELDLLHEDIQDMFIRDGVLTATGKRMCRILKDDPNALSPTKQKTSLEEIKKPEEPRRGRRRLVQPKTHLNNDEINTMKSVRVLISKMPDDIMQQRVLRSRTRKTSYVESDNESAKTEDDTIKSDSESESSEDEKEPKNAQTTANDTTQKLKVVKKRRSKIWASGIIKKIKKKNKVQDQSKENTPEPELDKQFDRDSDRSLLEPDKNYYLDAQSGKGIPCKVCDYTTKWITLHYRQVHPESEVLSSRFSPTIADAAIKDSLENTAKYEAITHKKLGKKYHFVCRFCQFSPTVFPLAFYEHITTHTGEYRHICELCNFSSACSKTMNSHYGNVHPGEEKKIKRFTYSLPIVFGYMCGECNFVQMSEKAVEEHANIFHLWDKPIIYKVNMSTHLDNALKESNENKNDVDGSSTKVDTPSSTPVPTPVPTPTSMLDSESEVDVPKKVVRRKPGPKSKTMMRTPAVTETETSEDEVAKEKSKKTKKKSVESVECSGKRDCEKAGKKPAAKKKGVDRQMSEEFSEDEILSIMRKGRAAKEVASAKLKFLMEATEASPRRRLADKEKTSKNSDKIEESKDSASEQEPEKEVENKKEEVSKPPPELNVFTCKTDIHQEESKKIEQERLKTMDELNRSIGSRASKLDFVDKLCNRLNNKEVMFKTERPDDDVTFVPPQAEEERQMPVLEKENVPTISTQEINPPVLNRKPVLKEEDMPVPSSFSLVQNKNNSLFSNMIAKLQDKLSEANKAPLTSTEIVDTREDAESPPAFPSDLPPVPKVLKEFSIGGMIKITKTEESTIFSCHVSSCNFSSSDKVSFQQHCKTLHTYRSSASGTLCEKCGVEITSIEDLDLLENVFDHIIYAHSDFIEDTIFAKPVGRVLRMRKLSGDKLSVKKENIDVDKKVEEPNPVSTTKNVLDIEPTTTVLDIEPVAEMAQLELSPENPFPFKIAGVMSLAEEQSPAINTIADIQPPPLASISEAHPPPLTLISLKQSPLLSQTHLIVKEAKLTQAELNRPRKAPKAMAKFVQAVSDLYKCPHYYCLFSTNFRDFLERHLKAHKVETEVMIPCVYCDMKTPWEHVPMHIDIRHAHCRYACNYCLYRSAVKEYVFWHQNQMHPDKDYSVIALPQHKHAKKFAIADVKVDPKSLCEPYRCSEDNEEFLFANEFCTHMIVCHPHLNVIKCAYKGCSQEVEQKTMINHWSLFHGVSVNQCGYCKMSCNELEKMYLHFAQFHQGCNPNILVRNVWGNMPNLRAGYSSEAFKLMKSIHTLQQHMFDKSTKKNKTLQIVPAPATVTSTTTKPISVMKPTSPKGLKSGIKTLIPIGPNVFSTNTNPNIKYIVASTSSNILFLPSSNTKFVTTVAPINKTSTSTSTSTTVTQVKDKTDANLQLPKEDGQPTQVQSQTSKQDLSLLDQTPDFTVSPINKKKEKDYPSSVDSTPESRTAPVEHIELAEDNTNDSTPDADDDPLNVDPLSGSSSASFQDPLSIDFPSKSNSPAIIDPLSMDAQSNASASVDPLSIESLPMPSLSGLDSFGIEPLSRPSSRISDPLSVSGLVRSNSIVSNSDDESDKDTGKKKQGLLGYQLFRCSCALSFSNANDFKSHVSQSMACRTDGNKPFKCVHCERQLKTVQRIVEHIQVHGVLRFSCSLCADRFPTHVQIKAHMKYRHNITQTTLVPFKADRLSLDHDEFVIRPILAHQPPTAKETSHELSKTTSTDDMTFTPDQIDNIPIRQIFSQNVKCGLCSYNTKVRINIVRHLKMHADERAVSDIAPVNPVPCLEKNEKMFDKMTNLAASSFSSRMGGNKNETKEKEDEKIPDFVPTHCRFVCCAKGCSYLCPEEGNLRHHLIALHSDETSFTCAHCQRNLTPTNADSIIKHFKLHGLHLYKCGYCTFVHHLKHKAERHVSDAHLDMSVKIVTVRCMESEPVSWNQDRSYPESPTVVTLKAFKPWRCCMCKCKCASFEDIKSHISSKHDIDAQFKCTLCTYKSDEKESFDDHFKAKHPNNEIDIIYVYRKVEEEQPKEQIEEFDTTPLWQRDRPRVRHIRGILFDESSPQPAKSPKKPPKYATPVKHPTSKNLFDCIDAVAKGTADILNNEASSSSVSEDFFQEINKAMPTAEEINEVKNLSAVIVIDDDDEEFDTKTEDETPNVKNKDNKDHPMAKNRGFKRKMSSLPHTTPVKIVKSEENVVIDSQQVDDELSEEKLKEEFGDIGTPYNKQLKCPICNKFKSKRINDFIFHIYRENNVFRLKCKICNDESITYKYMREHAIHHPLYQPDDIIVALPPNLKLETWIQMVIREQSQKILSLTSTNRPEPVGENYANSLKCHYCDKRFKNWPDSCEHMLTHWTIKPYACGYCKFDSYSESAIKLHHASTHPSLDLSVFFLSPTVAQIVKNTDETHKKRPNTDTEVSNLKKPRMEAPSETPNSVSETSKSEVKNNVATISDSEDDLVIISKTDSNVPSEDDVFACEYCPAMANSESLIAQHISAEHGSTGAIKFKVINKKQCAELTENYIACNICDKIGSEIEIRQHSLDKHCGLNFGPYRYLCGLCSVRYLTLRSLKMHFRKKHVNTPIVYKNLFEQEKTSAEHAPKPKKVNSTIKNYRCQICTFQSTSHSAQSIRMHIRGHIRPIECGVCGNSYKFAGEATSHFGRDHPGAVVKLITDKKKIEQYIKMCEEIQAKAEIVSQENPTRNNTARKSTSARAFVVDATTAPIPILEEFSYYGTKPEEVDLKKIMTTVEVQQVDLNISVEQLSKMVNLDCYVEVEDCNVGINLASLFNS